MLHIGSKKNRWLLLAAKLFILVLLLGSLAGCSGAESKTLTQDLAEPLNGATSAKIDLNTGTGHLSIDRLTGGEDLLAGGTLEYLENQEPPARSLTSFNGQSIFQLKASEIKQTGLRLPWDACTGETEWQLHLNPGLPYDINAYSGGGNVMFDLAGMAITSLTAETGGGNMTVVLPDNTENLNVSAKTGGGNVTVEIGSGITGSHTVVAGSGAGDVLVRLPAGIAARIHATSGVGKVLIDASFIKIDDKTYQSPDYETAANKVEITLNSGAGNVSVNTK